MCRYLISSATAVTSYATQMKTSENQTEKIHQSKMKILNPVEGNENRELKNYSISGYAPHILFTLL